MYNPYAQSTSDPNNPQLSQQHLYQQPQQPQQSYSSASASQQYGTQAHMNSGQFNSQHQQQQQQHQQQQGKPQSGEAYNTFFNDPAAQLGLHFSQSAFNASHNYMQENFGDFVSNQDIKYYFKVSNSYVIHKLFLILFPFKNKTWVRQFRSSTDVSSNQSVEHYATPIEDVNAPDLYIPLMSFISYILLWAVFSGVNGSFHPQLLGYATTRTLAFYFMDIFIMKVSFYVLGVSSKNSKIWDLASYSGYKFISILSLMMIKNLISSKVLIYISYFLNVFSLGFFLMRSLRYAVLPSGLDSNNLSPATKRIRTQYLFIYSFVIQAVLVWVMA
ncbi:hypothetical protein CANARDRAFT_28048 [[Candida] arabinofermentans NRRL YB-2248]|uniref:Protein YIF1 n=1 Tax=[Candida] arabinofermentans NRRL YB-2248 TaxID=983967 RepID=A0A1E4T2M2_9ASCO|nr:hypothetical protein CANARDRAFT_28048 [[Candida] arabinofermentans NRRL YB-2248]